MVPVKHCIGFAVDCGTMVKGIGVVVTAVILFIGSVYLLLTAIFGRWMGYLVLMVALTGWLMILSSLWFFGYWSQGPTTPTNQGPRGAQPAWIVLQASPGTTSTKYATFSTYPSATWKLADQTDKVQAANFQQATSAVQTFLATDPAAFQPTQFAVDDLRFANDGKTQLAVAQAHFNGGGPLWTVSMYYNSGSIPRYSIMFFAGSFILFLLHLPLLDRAEKKRKEFLTGGMAPAWYGPA